MRKTHAAFATDVAYELAKKVKLAIRITHRPQINVPAKCDVSKPVQNVNKSSCTRASRDNCIVQRRARALEMHSNLRFKSQSFESNSRELHGLVTSMMMDDSAIVQYGGS